MKQGKKEAIPALAKTDEGCSMLLVHKKQSIRDLVAAKLAITSWPTHAKKVRRMIRWAKCSGDKLPIFLKYYGGAVLIHKVLAAKAGENQSTRSSLRFVIVCLLRADRPLLL